MPHILKGGERCIANSFQSPLNEANFYRIKNLPYFLETTSSSWYIG